MAPREVTASCTDPGEFSDAYRDSYARAAEIALDSSIVGLAVRGMLEARAS